LGVCSYDLDVFLVLMKASSQTSYCAPCASTGNYSGDGTVCLIPDLFCCAELVRKGVVLVGILDIAG